MANTLEEFRILLLILKSITILPALMKCKVCITMMTVSALMDSNKSFVLKRIYAETELSIHVEVNNVTAEQIAMLPANVLLAMSPMVQKAAACLKSPILSSQRKQAPAEEK